MSDKEKEEELLLMQLQDEGDVFETVYGFFQSYLTMGDEEEALSYLSPRFHGIGIRESEVAIGREEFRQMFRQERQILPEPVYFRLEGWEQNTVAPGFHVCFAHMEMWTISPQGEEAAYRVRMSVTLHREGEGDASRYVIDGVHLSEASRRQEEGEIFPFRLAEEGAQLSRQVGQELQRIVSQVMPGGIVGSYAEEGFPFYVANQKMLRMMGYDSFPQLMEETGGLMLSVVHPEDREFVVNAVNDSFRTGEQYEIQYRLRRKDGSYIWVHDIGRKTVDGEGRGAIISVVIDISQQVNTKKHLEKELALDFLTGVRNRKGGEEQISRMLKEKPDYLFVMIDLDNFKQVNDSYGHDQGDRALQYAAGEMEALFPEPDVVCRLGGDEFIIFVGASSQVEETREKLQKLLCRYVRKMEECWPLAHSTISAGGVYGDQPMTFAQLYKRADQVLYQVKQKGKGRIQLSPA